ncbi:unknown [Veillonella sp. CAG:933]|nr:unknown [Veillonella sp. CAG:933]
MFYRLLYCQYCGETGVLMLQEMSFSKQLSDKKNSEWLVKVKWIIVLHCISREEEEYHEFGLQSCLEQNEELLYCGF